MADEKTQKEEKKEVSKTVEKLVDEISKLSVLELSELVNELSEKLGVSAMPVAAAAPATAVSEDAPATKAPGATNQTITMTSSGANKINVIKALREINSNLSLMDAKGMTENVPAEILKDAKTDDVTAAKEKLIAAGAEVEVK